MCLSLAEKNSPEFTAIVKFNSVISAVGNIEAITMNEMNKKKKYKLFICKI